MKLSIIIPVYNVEAYVGQTLSSVFDTTANLADFEVIVVNDGTDDGSMEVVRQYADRQNLVILEQKNQGLSAARNCGLDHAKGEYLFLQWREMHPRASLTTCIGRHLFYTAPKLYRFFKFGFEQ